MPPSRLNQYLILKLLSDPHRRGHRDHRVLEICVRQLRFDETSIDTSAFEIRVDIYASLNSLARVSEGYVLPDDFNNKMTRENFERVNRRLCRVVKRLERYRTVEVDGCALDITARCLLGGFPDYGADRGDILQLSGECMEFERSAEHGRLVKNIDAENRKKRRAPKAVDHDGSAGLYPSVPHRASEIKPKALRGLLVEKDLDRLSLDARRGRRAARSGKCDKDGSGFIDLSDHEIIIAGLGAGTLDDQKFISSTVLGNSLDQHGDETPLSPVMSNNNLLLSVMGSIEASSHSLVRHQLLSAEFVERTLKEQERDLELSINPSTTKKMKEKKAIALRGSNTTTSTNCFVTRTINASYYRPGTVGEIRSTQNKQVNVQDDSPSRVRRVNKYTLDSLGRISQQCWS